MTVLGIMQPYFFPYPGYFSLIKGTDKWVVFDTPQYVYRSWINRNRIIDPNHNGWIYITVPICRHKLKTPINKIQIYNRINWRKKIISQLGYYRKRAPYYNRVVEFLTETLSYETDSLSELNVHTLKETCAYIGIDFDFQVFSEMNLEVEPVNAPDEWGVNICKAMNLASFINPELGQTFVSREKYEKKGVKLRFLIYDHPEYDQKRKDFIPSLSILDAMMFNSPEAVNQMLDEYHLVS